MEFSAEANNIRHFPTMKPIKLHLFMDNLAHLLEEKHGKIYKLAKNLLTAT